MNRQTAYGKADILRAKPDETREQLSARKRLYSLKYLRGIPFNCYTTHTFDKFTPTDGTKQALIASYNFVGLKPDGSNQTDEEWDKGTWKRPPILTLYGGTGLGKTHLAMAILIHQEDFDEYWQVENLLDELRHCYASDDKEAYYDLIKQLKECEILVLDDLGAEKLTDWAGAKLDQIIDDRYINDKSMIITTNLSAKGLPPRIASRILSGQVVHMTGNDYRLKQGNEYGV